MSEEHWGEFIKATHDLALSAADLSKLTRDREEKTIQKEELAKRLSHLHRQIDLTKNATDAVVLAVGKLENEETTFISRSEAAMAERKKMEMSCQKLQREVDEMQRKIDQHRETIEDLQQKIKVYQEGKKKLAALVQVAQGELHLKQKEKTRYRQEISKMDRSAHGMSEKMKDALISTAQLVHRIESTRVSANRPTSASKSRPESRQSRPPSRSSTTPSTVNTNATRKTDSSK